MSISATTRLAFLPFRTTGGPFPDGIWTSQQTGIGDASGGDLIITHEVVTFTEPLSALMLTLEQLTIDTDRNGNIDFLLEILGFEEHNPVGNNNVLMNLVTRQGLGLSATPPSEMLRRPLFLGRVDRTSGQGAQLSIRSANVDGSASRDALWGYFWGPGAMNVPGGPQRPPGSIFGS